MSDEALILDLFFDDPDPGPTPEERRAAARKAKRKELERNKGFDAYRGRKRKAKQGSTPSERRRYERADGQRGLSPAALAIYGLLIAGFLGGVFFVLVVAR